MSETKCHNLKLGKLFEIVWWKDFPCFKFTYAKCGYFDGRPQITIALIFIHVVFKMPWINSEWTDECCPPEYGIGIHYNTLWIYKGGLGNLGGNDFWTWDIPFLTKKFYKHEILCKDGSWVDVTKERSEKIPYLNWCKNNENEDKENDMKSPAKIYYGEFKDNYDGSIIKAKYLVEIRRWRPKWLMWTKKFELTHKEIDICFKDEVGSGKDTWKGGVIGTGHLMKEGETAHECFERFLEEKDF